jgi:hypothetical protein
MKYALIFALLAFTLLANACLAGTWWAAVLLAWPGVALALVAGACSCNAPVLFGKRPDGRIAWPNSIYPFLCATGPALGERSRKAVPIGELWSLMIDLRRQVDGRDIHDR